MTGQVFPDLPQTPPPEPPADPPAQKEPAETLTPAQEMADALSAPEVETPDVSDSPFCRAMGLIAGGLAVTGVTLNFWNLDVLLPLVGTFCLLVGFRALRRVNGFLRAGYVCACLHMLLLFVELGQDAVIYRADTGLAAFFTVVAAAVQLVLLFCLWQGLLDMQRDAGITPPAAPAAGALLLWYRAMLGYMPQDLGIYPEFTAKRYLLYIAALKGLTEAQAKAEIDKLLEAVGLSSNAEQKLKGFSGGMLRRVGIAQTLLCNPQILLLDEPTAGLDPQERVRLRNLLSALAQHSIIILSTHIVSDVELIAEKIILLREGQIAAFDTVSGLVGKSTLEDVYLTYFQKEA